MQPIADLLLVASAAAYSPWGAAGRLALTIGLFLAAAGAWFFFQRRFKGSSRRLEVLDRAQLARGSSVILLQVENRRLLVGVSNHDVRLIRDLGSASPAKSEPGFTGHLVKAARVAEAER